MKGRYFTGLSSYIAMPLVDVALQALNAAIAVRISRTYLIIPGGIGSKLCARIREIPQLFEPDCEIRNRLAILARQFCFHCLRDHTF